MIGSVWKESDGEKMWEVLEEAGVLKGIAPEVLEGGKPFLMALLGESNQATARAFMDMKPRMQGGVLYALHMMKHRCETLEQMLSPLATLDLGDVMPAKLPRGSKKKRAAGAVARKGGAATRRRSARTS